MAHAAQRMLHRVTAGHSRNGYRAHGDPPGDCIMEVTEGERGSAPSAMHGAPLLRIGPRAPGRAGRATASRSDSSGCGRRIVAVPPGDGVSLSGCNEECRQPLPACAAGWAQRLGPGAPRRSRLADGLLFGWRTHLMELAGMVTRVLAMLTAVGRSHCMSVTDAERVLSAGPPNVCVVPDIRTGRHVAGFTYRVPDPQPTFRGRPWPDPAAA